MKTMFDRYNKRFLYLVVGSLTELVSGDDKLGCCGLCHFLSKRTSSCSLSYDFVDDFMTNYNIKHIPNVGIMSPERIVLARKIIKEVTNYLEK